MSNIRIQRIALKRDAHNYLKYGRGFPKSFQKVYVSTNSISVRNNSLRYEQSCEIVPGNWDKDVFSIWSDHPSNRNFLSAYRKYTEGLSWQDVGSIESILLRWKKHGALQENVENRLANLDEIYSKTSTTLRLPSMAEVGAFREFGGILVHFDRNLNPILGRGGNHRLAIARALQISFIPVQLGVIHADLTKSPKELEKLKEYFSINKSLSS